MGVRNGSKNMSTWLNTLKYNLSDTIKKWYPFPDLAVVCLGREGLDQREAAGGKKYLRWRYF